MKAFWSYLKMELKRAVKRLPFLVLGTAALVLLLSGGALLGKNMLYGNRISGRIKVAVILPEQDPLSRKAMGMLQSLESVKSLCDFTNMSREEAENGLKKGSVYAALFIPEGFVQDIMSGTNTPVTVVLADQSQMESRIFKELTQGGSKILGAAQAGIYSGDEYLIKKGRQEEIPALEDELNRLYLEASLPRMDYFKKVKINGAGNISITCFYGISASVLVLLFSVLSVAGFLLPWNKGMRESLDGAGMGPEIRTAGRILGLSFLLFCITFPGVSAAVVMDQIPVKHLLSLEFAKIIALSVLTDLSAAAFCNGLFRLSGSLPGGVLLLFLVTTVSHFAAGGFLPKVFLPQAVQRVSSCMPTAVLMDAFRSMVTESMGKNEILRLMVLFTAGFLVSWFKEVQED